MLFSLLCEFGLGIFLGWLGGIFGIGGGLIAIPALVGIFGFTQQLAQGTALVMIAPNVLLGFWLYRRRNPIEIKSAFLIGIPSIISTYLAASYSSSLPSRSLQIAFAIFLMAVSLSFFVKGRPPKNSPSQSLVLPRWCLSLLGLVSGVFSGLFTVGGGLIVAPALLKFFDISRQTAAQGLALAAVAPGAVVALLIYASQARVDWAAGIAMAVGAMISMSWGVKIAHRLPERHLRNFFAGFIFLIALWLIS